MNKEQLRDKLNALETDVNTRRQELGVAIADAQVIREEIADAGKPVVSQSTIDDIVTQLSEMFSDIISNADPCDMSPEFSMSYNEVCLDALDISNNICVSDHDIQGILEDFFAIEKHKEEDEDEDEDEDLESISSTGREGRE